VGKIPEDRDPRLASLEEWAKSQQSRLAAEEQTLAAEEMRLAAEEQRRLWAEEIVRVVDRARQRAGQVDSHREVAAIPVVITKPSDHPVDRAAVFADLMVRLGEYKWADPVVSVCDGPMYIAPQAIELARRRQPDARWLLYMEDDVILGPDFDLLPGLLREANELFPDTGLVSFFSMAAQEPGWSIHPMRGFSCLQCAAIRNTDHLVGFRTVIDHVMTQGGGEFLYGIPDLAVANFLTVEYDSYALWCPSLVQHADVTSAFYGQPAGGRTSWSYRQAYG
jgi:hypothetical protein